MPQAASSLGVFSRTHTGCGVLLCDDVVLQRGMVDLLHFKLTVANPDLPILAISQADDQGVFVLRHYVGRHGLTKAVHGAAAAARNHGIPGI